MAARMLGVRIRRIKIPPDEGAAVYYGMTRKCSRSQVEKIRGFLASEFIFLDENPRTRNRIICSECFWTELQNEQNSGYKEKREADLAIRFFCALCDPCG